MSSKSSKKKKKKKLQRYYKNGKNVYPYAEASRVLWSIGFTVAIFVGLIVSTQTIMFLLQKTTFGWVFKSLISCPAVDCCCLSSNDCFSSS